MRRCSTPLRLLLLAFLSCLLGSPDARAQQAPVEPATNAGPVNRELLAWWYLEVDRAWEEARPKADAAKIKAAHEAFDHATLAFFRLDMATAISELAELRRSLRAQPAGPDVPPLALEASPRVWLKGSPPPSLTLTSLRTLTKAPSTLTLRMRDGTGRTATHSLAWPNAAAGDDRRWALDAASWREAGPWHEAESWFNASHPVLVTCTVELEGIDVASDRVVLSADSLTAMGERLRTAAETIAASNDAMRQAVGMFKARCSLLTDAPSRNKAGEFLAPYDTLPASLEAELAALKEGRSPYPLEGRWWTSIKTGRGAIPCWFDAPKDRTSGRPPLLIVFHGAGGDESMFVFGYGQGSLVRKAVERGMVVASVATGAAMGSASGVKSIIKQAAQLYGTDPDRVYVAGHSMGGFATSTTAQHLTDLVAAAVCFAGGTFDASLPCVPTLVLAGEVDPLIPGSRLRLDVDKAVRAGGLPLTFRMCEGNGHTLLVGDHADEALEFLEGKRRVDVKPAKPSEHAR
jgi:Dienelactone hydrolase family